MQRIGVVLVSAVLVVGGPRAAAAQEYAGGIFVGGGVTLPMGDFGEYAKTGWMASGGLAYNLSPRIWIQGEGMFGSNSHDDVDGDKTELLGAAGGIGYAFGNLESSVVPYVLGGVGVLSHKYKPATGESVSESEMMFYGGGGLYLPRGSYGFFLEARYVSRDDTQFVPIMVGVQVNFGRK